jgi:membrane protease YdiL (CAAX protease family)
VLEASIEIQRDAANTVTSLVDSGYESVDQMHWANARLSVLLAESGRYDEAMEAAEESEGAQIEAARAALASSLQSEEGKEQGARLLRRSDAMTAANALMIAAGVLVLIALARGAVRLEAPVPLVVPWSMSLGFAVIVRADFWNRLYFLSLAYLEELHSGSEWLGPLYTWGTLIASLPMLWLIYRYLLPSTPGALLEPFGLDVRSLRWQRIAKIAGAIVSINFLGTTVIAWGSWGLGFDGHWAEGLDESLIWGSARELVETSIDYVVLTPVLEEILFRGLLFFTLRNRFGAWQAALLSSLLFSAVHFYSLPGFLMTFWSGFVWAIGFERAHSLLPGIIAHAIYNSFFVAGIVLIYR